MEPPSEIVPWTDTFFSGKKLPFEVLDEPQGLSTFQNFPAPDRRWIFGRRLSEHNGSPIVVFRLYAKEDGVKTSYAAKTFPKYTIDHAQEQWYRIPSTWFTTQDIKDEYDSFLNETRAFEHISRVCTESQKIYFPRYHGILIPIDRHKFDGRFQPRNQAVVLEYLTPDTRSRRILCKQPTPANVFHKVLQFPQKLNGLSLTQFEKDWYMSLLDNRLRRANVLHDIGIVHNDIHDRHFRLPGDFYDTVLYDFSVAYTISGKWPYRMSIGRRQRTMDTVREGVQINIADQIFDRAKETDFRHHVAKRFALQVEVVEELFSSSLNGSQDLELIVMKVMHRPDEFTTPSLSSVFPFLEAMCPKEDPAWCIHRARQLDFYDTAWLVSTEHGCSAEKRPSTVSIQDRVFLDVDDITKGRTSFFWLVLVPRVWEVEDIAGSVNGLYSWFQETEKPVGTTMTREQFESV